MSRDRTSPVHPPAAEPLAHRLAGLMIDDAPAQRRRRFTPDEARRTLPLIGRIAADAAGEWQRAKALHDALDALGRDGDRAARRELSRGLVDSVRKLELLSEEAVRVGVDLTEYRTGTVAFPGHCAGREVTLSWRLGESSVEHWHEAREVTDRRRPLSELTD